MDIEEEDQEIVLDVEPMDDGAVGGQLGGDVQDGNVQGGGQGGDVQGGDQAGGA